MSSKKQRPPNAPGANGLRGGRNIYSLKTLAGNWVEEIGGPEYCNRGFTCKDFETESQHQQVGGYSGAVTEFGAALPKDISLPRVSKDIFNPAGGPQSSDWQTNTHAMLASAFKEKENPKIRTVDKSEVEKYRNAWTIDTVTSRNMRFQTESRRASNIGVKEEFVVNTVRYLPGIPIAFERFRNRLIERYGLMAFPCLRNNCSTSEYIKSADFPKFVKSLGIQMSDVECLQISNHIAERGEINCNQFINVLLGNVDYSVIDKLIHELFYHLADDNCIDVDAFSMWIHSPKHADIAEGVKVFCGVYAVSNGPSRLLYEDSFCQMQKDMYNASPPLYIALIKDKHSL